LAHLAATLNDDRQHAGLENTPIIWSALYQATNEAKPSLRRLTPWHLPSKIPVTRVVPSLTARRITSSPEL
jgi:hypothetical protein